MDEPQTREQLPRNYFEMCGGRPRCGWQYGDGKLTRVSGMDICGVCQSEWETNDAPEVAPCIVDHHNKRDNRRRHNIVSEYNPLMVPAHLTYCRDCSMQETKHNHITVDMGGCISRLTFRVLFVFMVMLIVALIWRPWE